MTVPVLAPSERGSPRAEIVVDLDAIRHNTAVLASRVAPAALMVVVKADGYGHGMVEAARAARSGGADWLGVAFLEEAAALRRSGDDGPLLCWLAVPGEDYRPAVAAGVDVTAYSQEQLEEIVGAARAVGVQARVQLKVDTGLGRGGATAQAWPGLVRAAGRAEASGSIRVTGLWSHLACADDPDNAANDAQEAAFRDAVAVARAAGLNPDLVHLANSAAALTRPTARFGLVRCGLAAYGLSPVPQQASSAALGLRPAMTARTRVAVAKRVPAGTGVSYGHTYRTERETTVAVLPVGYAEGLLRSGSSRAPVLVGGRRRQISGTVCMDQVVVDVGDDPVRAGDPVVLFGAGDGSGEGPAQGSRDAPEATAQEWAEACGTISYEIVTRMGGRFVRRHLPTGTAAPDTGLARPGGSEDPR